MIGVFVDLRKAFDTISPAILLEKLSDVGVSGKALEILTSYLQDRTQIVKIGHNLSYPCSVTYGVPQGSILGPLLFLIYINNVHQIGLKGDISLYADDTSLFYSGHSTESIIPDIQRDLNLLNDWFKLNLLTINTSKTNYVIFAAKNKIINNNIQLTINGQTIQRKTKETYLGLILDNYLNWKPQIKKLKSKLTSLTGTIRCIARNLPRKVKYIIYNSLVKPHLDYLIELWGTAAKTNINILQTAQNKLIKTLFNYNYRTSTQKIYAETKLMNLNQTYVYYTCLLVHKIFHNEIKSKIGFTKKHQHQKIKLRNGNHLALPKCVPRTGYGKNTIEFEGVKLYNKLPTNIKDAKSTASFKRQLKRYILR